MVRALGDLLPPIWALFVGYVVSNTPPLKFTSTHPLGHTPTGRGCHRTTLSSTWSLQALTSTHTHTLSPPKHTHTHARARTHAHTHTSYYILCVRYLDQYTAVHINATDEEPAAVDDEDGEVMGIEALLSQILNVIRILMDSPRKEHKGLIRASLCDLVLYTLTYAQMTVRSLSQQCCCCCWSSPAAAATTATTTAAAAIHPRITHRVSPPPSPTHHNDATPPTTPTAITHGPGGSNRQMDRRCDSVCPRRGRRRGRSRNAHAAHQRSRRH
jgi:hypothetical protein